MKRQIQSSKEEYLKKYDQNMKSGQPVLKRGMFYYMLMGLILLTLMVMST
jgi:hypothetical protein|tara:strand:- start:690 stop:839 length:150 start_codon:yes stop_codon:yes gene_type:complete